MSTPLSFGDQYQGGSHTGPQPPARCRNCGRVMRVYKTQGATGARKYLSDGTPNMIRHAECSAPRVLRWIGYHDHATQDEHGDWPWV